MKCLPCGDRMQTQCTGSKNHKRKLKAIRTAIYKWSYSPALNQNMFFNIFHFNARNTYSILWLRKKAILFDIQYDFFSFWTDHCSGSEGKPLHLETANMKNDRDWNSNGTDVTPCPYSPPCLHNLITKTPQILTYICPTSNVSYGDILIDLGHQKLFITSFN